VNYYEHHLGDYMRDTAHLSMVEDGAYRRLLDAYYIKEAPIPLDHREACRLVRAQSKPERDAVQVVLKEFFQQGPDGWQHNRCDREIARFQTKRAKAQSSANARWGAKQTQSVGNANAYANASDDSMRTHDERNAHHTPDTSNQTPDTRPNTHTPGDAEVVESSAVQRVSMAGAVCVALKAAGISAVNPGHPDLAALLDAGAEVQNFLAATPGAKGKGNPFAYVLGTVKGQLETARRIAAQGRVSNPAAGLGSSGSDRRAARMAEAVPGLTTHRPPQGEIIDMEARDVTPRSLG